ncbi:MAG: hypothetical protein ACAH59_00825, partial [Pseudobdellovibrionaceae bacterium]
LKSKHHLTDAQIQAMRDGGLTYPQMAMASRLSEKSGKTVDDILKMRNDENMGWGKIAKELGISPKEIGQSVAALRHEIHMDRKIAKAERQETRRAEKAAKKAERMGKKNH